LCLTGPKTFFFFLFFFFWRTRFPPPPPLTKWARAPSFTRFLDHKQRRTTVGRTALDDWPARCKDLYLTTHNTHNRQTSMPPVGFEPEITESERPQTHVLDRAATGIGCCEVKCLEFIIHLTNNSTAHLVLLITSLSNFLHQNQHLFETDYVFSIQLLFLRFYSSDSRLHYVIWAHPKAELQNKHIIWQISLATHHCHSG